MISKGVSVDGTISGQGSLTVAGRVRGEVKLTGGVVVAATGRLDASVEAAEVTVEGRVEGRITGTRRVTLAAQAHVKGDINSERVSIHPDARFVGRLNMPVDLSRGVGGARQSGSRYS